MPLFPRNPPAVLPARSTSQIPISGSQPTCLKPFPAALHTTTHTHEPESFVTRVPRSHSRLHHVHDQHLGNVPSKRGARAVALVAVHADNIQPQNNLAAPRSSPELAPPHAGAAAGASPLLVTVSTVNAAPPPQLLLTAWATPTCDTLASSSSTSTTSCTCRPGHSTRRRKTHQVQPCANQALQAGPTTWPALASQYSKRASQHKQAYRQ